jgi:hypothetical protein
MTEARTHGRVFIRHYRVMWTVPMPLDQCHDTNLVLCQKKSRRCSGVVPGPFQRQLRGTVRCGTDVGPRVFSEYKRTSVCLR